VPILEDVTGLTALYDAEAWVRPEMDKPAAAAVATVWRDIGSGSSRYLQSAGTGALAPYQCSGGPNRKPYICFSGAAGCYYTSSYAGLTLANFIDAAAATVVLLARVKSVAASQEVLWGQSTALPALVVKDTGGVPTVYSRDTSGSADKITAGLAFALNTWHLFALVHRSGQLLVFVDGIENKAAVACGNSDALGGRMQLGYGPASLGVGDLDLQKALIYNVGKTDLELGKIFSYLKACGCSPETTTVAERVRGAAEDQARVVAGARCWRDRAPRKTVVVTYPLAALDQEMLSDVAIAHPRGLDPEGAGGGWPDVETGRRLMRVIKQTPNWSKKTVAVEYADLRSYVANYVESAETIRLATPARIGSVVLGRAAVRRFMRETPAWVRDPSSGLVVKVAAGRERSSSEGLVLERAAANRILRGALIAGSTGLTATNGSGSTSVETTPPFLFDTSVQPTQQWLKLTAGAPNTTGPKWAWPTTADLSGYLPTGCHGWLVIDHTDDATQAPKYVRVTAVINGNTRYLDAATGAWVVANTTNEIPAAPVGTIARWATKIPTSGSQPITMTVEIGLTNGGVASRSGGIYSVEIQTNVVAGSGVAPRCPTSWIPTNTAAVVRYADFLSIDDESTDGILNGGQGVFRFLFTPAWSASDFAAGESAVFAMAGEYADGAYWSLGYDKDSASFQVVRVQGGNTYTASAPWAPVAGTESELGMRWCGSRGAPGIAPYTLSALVNAVPGTDVVLGGAVAAAQHLHWHNAPAVANAYAADDVTTPDGTIRCIESLPLVLSNRELLARLRRI
jgi:hypothetical protein